MAKRREIPTRTPTVDPARMSAWRREEVGAKTWDLLMMRVEAGDLHHDGFSTIMTTAERERRRWPAWSSAASAMAGMTDLKGETPFGRLVAVTIDKTRLEYEVEPLGHRPADFVLPERPSGTLWLVEVKGFEGGSDVVESKTWDVDVFEDLEDAERLAETIDANVDVRSCVGLSRYGHPFHPPAGSTPDPALETLRLIHEGTATMDDETRDAYLRDNVDVITWMKKGSPEGRLDTTSTWVGCFASFERVRILPLAERGRGLWRWRRR